MDRTRASQIGLTQRDVANNLLVSLSSSGQVAPNFWLNPQNGVNYIRRRADAAVPASIRSTRCGNTPVHAAERARAQLLSNVASVRARARTMSVVNHYNVQPVFDVYANVQDRDLGGVARDVDRIVVKAFARKLPAGSFIDDARPGGEHAHPRSSASASGSSSRSCWCTC